MVVIRLFRSSPAIEVEHIVDWDEKHKLVKAEFSCNVLSRELICDTSAGYIKRETHTNTSCRRPVLRSATINGAILQRKAAVLP